MATILDEKKSTYGGPYCYYTVKATSSNRTVNSVDISFTITSHLQSSTSYLGSGYKLTGYVYIGGSWKSVVLKASSATWSGTTTHTSTFSTTISGLTASQTSITGIKFKVVNSSSSTSSSTLTSTSCSNITIAQGHTLPTIVVNSVTENASLSGITGTDFVPYLSRKSFNITINCSDSATPSSVIMTDVTTNTNYTLTGYTSTTGEQTFTSNVVSFNEIGSNANFKFTILDSLNTTGVVTQTYTYVSYKKPNLVDVSTTAKRDGQLSGKAKLNVLGSFFNGVVGSTTNQLTLQYRRWEKTDTEPATWISITPTITNDNFSVSDLAIGNDEFFDYRYSYYVKVQAVDSFGTSYTVLCSILVGEAVWSEYSDRVDFKKLTVKGNDPTFYESGDTYSCTSLQLGGCLTSSKTQIRFSIFTPKLLTNISTITTNSMDLSVRYPAGGYLIAGTVSTSIVTITKTGDNSLLFTLENSAGWGSTNNTPLSVQVNSMSLTFS